MQFVFPLIISISRVKESMQSIVKINILKYFIIFKNFDISARSNELFLFFNIIYLNEIKTL